jgi:hypothetical protein
MTLSGGRRRPDWDGGGEQCEACVVRQSSCGGNCFFAFVGRRGCQAGIVFSGNGSSYDKY